jgi:hypothetical protein
MKSPAVISNGLKVFRLAPLLPPSAPAPPPPLTSGGAPWPVTVSVSLLLGPREAADCEGVGVAPVVGVPDARVPDVGVPLGRSCCERNALATDDRENEPSPEAGPRLTGLEPTDVATMATQW